MKRILVVEDDPLTREAYQDLFYILGYATLMACDGNQGLALAVSENPDLIISDKQMPGMDGYAMVKELKSNPQTRNIPILGCGSFSAEEQKILDYYVEKGSSAGFSELVRKILGEPNKS